MLYNLLDENWIPVLYHNGVWKRVGILKALSEAHQIRQIAASNPMDRVAVLRFLLAILYWCRGNPPDDPKDLPQDRFPDEWFVKLEENRDCFELLGDGKRFYQFKGAETYRSINELIHEIPNGTNFWHFQHASDDVQALCPACISIGLLRLPMFTTVKGLGAKGKPFQYAGINGPPPIYTMPIGQSLFHSLLLNWVGSDNTGLPNWEKYYIPNGVDDQVPLLAGITIPGRQVWLHDPADSRGTCFHCGLKDQRLIYSAEIQSAGKLDDYNWTDPHVIYYGDKERKSSKAFDLTMPGQFKINRPWMDWLSRLVLQPQFKEHSQLLVVGFGTDLKAKYADIWEKSIWLSSTCEKPELQSEAITKWRKEGGRLEWRSSRANELGIATITSIRPHVEDLVARKLSELLSADEEQWKDIANLYSPMMRAVAETLSPGYTTNAYQRRQYISHLKPDMKSDKENKA